MVITILNSENISVNSNEQKLDILKKYGDKASISDFGVLLGDCVSGTEYTRDGENIQNQKTHDIKFSIIML